MPSFRPSVASVCLWYLRSLSLLAQRRAVVSDPSPPCVASRLVPRPVHSTHQPNACSTFAAAWASTTQQMVVSDLIAGSVASGASPLDALSPSDRPDSPSAACVPAKAHVCPLLLPLPACLPTESPSPSSSVAPGMRIVFDTLPPRRPPPWPDPPSPPCAVSMLLLQAHFIMKWPCSTHWLPPSDPRSPDPTSRIPSDSMSYGLSIAPLPSPIRHRPLARCKCQNGCLKPISNQNGLPAHISTSRNFPRHPTTVSRAPIGSLRYGLSIAPSPTSFRGLQLERDLSSCAFMPVVCAG